jgi:hypothetical protein
MRKVETTPRIPAPMSILTESRLPVNKNANTIPGKTA